jgi:hypothetical protein
MVKIFWRMRTSENSAMNGTGKGCDFVGVVSLIRTCVVRERRDPCTVEVVDDVVNLNDCLLQHIYALT